MSSIQLFSVKDKVFVKRRGYPAWPALIIGIKANTESEPIYTVYFYGTGNYGECKSQLLCPYEQYKYKLGKPRRKQKKFKKFAEALIQIENDAKIDFLSANDVEISEPPISTTNINQELSLEDESKNVSGIENQCEFNSQNEENEKEKSTHESSLSKGKKVVTSRKRVSNSTDLKRKISDVELEKIPKKLKKSINFKPMNVQPIVLLEPLKDTFLERKMKKKQNFETASKIVAANETISETLNTTESVLESSDISLNQCETAESIKINDSVQSDLGRTSRFGRKIKPNRISDHEFVTKVPNYLKLKIADSKSVKVQSSANCETSDSLKQNVKTRGSTKARNSLKSNVISIPCSLDSASQEICQVNNSHPKKHPPINSIKNVMGSSNVEVEWKKMESNKADQVNLLLTEVNLLDYVNKLSSALSIDYRKLNYEMALKSLEQISELQFNALMLKKHRCIVDKITKVTKYVGDVNNWSLSNEEAIEHFNKANQIRCKAQSVLYKCISLFTVLDGQTFQEVYNQEVNVFIAKTQHLTNDEIYGCTSDKLYKI